MDVIVVCHTEFGEVRNRQVVATRDTEGVVAGVSNLAEVADRYGAKITYAVCPEVVPYFPKGVNGEIGLHIHPGRGTYRKEGIEFTIGDVFLRKYCKQSSNSTVLRDYSFSEQMEMIRMGRNYLENMLGVQPKSFVAGRWSVNNDTITALTTTGFTHDCSAVPSRKDKHFDWSKLPRQCMPYHPSSIDYQEQGDCPLLILPISQIWLIGGCANPEIARQYTVNWLKLCFAEYHWRKRPLFHICLHSPCMRDPYYIGAMEELLAFTANHDNVEFKFASEIKDRVGSSS